MRAPFAAAAITIAVAVTVAGCGGSSPKADGPPAAGTALDGATVSACREAGLALRGPKDADQTLQHARDARQNASTSGKQALRDIVAKDTDPSQVGTSIDDAKAMAAATALATWCSRNHVPAH